MGSLAFGQIVKLNQSGAIEGIGLDYLMSPSGLCVLAPSLCGGHKLLSQSPKFSPQTSSIVIHGICEKYKYSGSICDLVKQELDVEWGCV